MSAAIIREEKPGDAAAIEKLHRAEFSGNAEADLVEEMRGSGKVLLSLVAEDGGKIVGHILYSKIAVDGVENAAALGPIAIDDGHQKRGLGSQLIEEAHRRLPAMGTVIVFVLGDPAYYRRFGFSAQQATAFHTPYDGPYMQSVKLSRGAPPSGTVVYPSPFAKFN
jgi:putative acetyltransferase